MKKFLSKVKSLAKRSKVAVVAAVAAVSLDVRNWSAATFNCGFSAYIFFIVSVS